MFTQLKLERLKIGETQAQAAERIGISVGLLRELEAGRAIPSDRVSALLARAYRAPTPRLLRARERGARQALIPRRRLE